MNGIEKITQQILADAQTEVDSILAQANAEAAEIKAQYDAQAAAMTASHNEKNKAAADNREARLSSMADMETRKLTLAAKQDMVDRAFQNALSDLTALPEEDYINLLASLVVKTCTTGREEVIFSEKDRDRVGKAVVTKANETLAKTVAPKLPEELTDTKAGAVIEKVVNGASALLSGTGMLTMAEETRKMAGGIILRNEKVETNCSFEVLIHLQRDTLAAEVAKVLF